MRFRKRCTSNGDDSSLEGIVKQSRFKNLGEPPRTEGMGSKCHSPSVWPLSNQGQKSSFQTEGSSSWHFMWKSRSQSLKGERRGTESKLPEVQCEVSTLSDDSGRHVICWCCSTVFLSSPDSTQASTRRLPSTPSAVKLYGDADFLFQQDLTPVHAAKTGLLTTVLLCLTSQLTGLT